MLQVEARITDSRSLDDIHWLAAKPIRPVSIPLRRPNSTQPCFPVIGVSSQRRVSLSAAAFEALSGSAAQGAFSCPYPDSGLFYAVLTAEEAKGDRMPPNCELTRPELRQVDKPSLVPAAGDCHRINRVLLSRP